uniref:Dynein light chain n=2 Tax=Caenorhabditis japonica TaxID=281687 RepID=A0A8R1HR04_CAEJA
MAIPEEEVHMIIKQVLDEVVGPNAAYSHKDSVQWNQKAVEQITKKLVGAGKPYKYVVTSSFLQISSGSGLNVSTISYWNKITDSSYMYRWEAKAMLAIVYVFAIAI